MVGGTVSASGFAVEVLLLVVFDENRRGSPNTASSTTATTTGTAHETPRLRPWPPRVRSEPHVGHLRPTGVRTRHWGQIGTAHCTHVSRVLVRSRSHVSS